ncbi:MAG: HAMP domain-containing sensor histidine kinase [Myxococcota bacterium]
MAARRNLRSVSTPIILGAVSIVLSVALLVGWTLLISLQLGESEHVVLDVWLLVLGSVSFAVIVTVLVLFSVYLAREIIEVRRQTSFIDSVTHELKSPLASLKLCLETISRHDLPAEKREELRGMMLDDVDRLTSFIDDVLQASRLADGKELPFDLTDVHLRALCRSIADAMAQRRKVDPDSIEVDVPRDMVVSTDEPALTIILKNLIDNALKYSESGRPIFVRARRDERGRVTIEVEDRGIGMDRGELKRVFHRFYRVANSEVRERKGTGLGLFVVSALVKNLGGSVRALSEGRGEGSTLQVTLPANDEAVTKPEEAVAL